MSVLSTDTEVAVVVTLRTDGSGQVSCGLGTVGVKSLDGTQSVTLHPNEMISISADGKFQAVQPIVASSRAQATPTPAARGRSRTGIIILGASVAGGTAAAIALLTHHNQPVSPASP